MTVDESRKVLGVDADADEKAVRRAYAALAKAHRPETHPTEFLSIRTAYDVLLASLKEDSYQDPSLPAAPNTAAIASPKPAPQLVDGHVVSYVIAADEFGRMDRDGPTPQSLGDEPSDNNPLQAMEDGLVKAIKATQPGVSESEDKVIELVEQYLRAAGATSRQLRDYVERFLIGACLGDYYVPHAMRVRVADLCGLHNTVVSEDRLKPWEKELMTRFDESEWLRELLDKAASKDNVAEHALVHGAGWSKTLSLRIGHTKSKTVKRWVNWLDNTYGSDAGVVNEQFRNRWHRSRQVRPVNGPVLLVFAVFMMVSGWVLDGLGVPLRHFLDMPTLQMLQTSASLALLSWANFILVQLARPVIDRLISKVRDALFEYAPIPLLVIEVFATGVLIWVWSFQPVLPDALSAALMVAAGVVMLLIGVFARVWDKLTELSFMTFGVRLVWHLSIFIFLVFFHGSQSGADNLGALGRWSSSDVTSSAWLLLGLTLMAVPPRILHRWHEIDPANKRLSLTHIRHTNITFNTVWPRLIIGCGAGVCLVGVGLEYVLVGSSWVSPLVTAVLLSLLALEIALAGGLNDDTNPAQRLIAYSACFVFYWLATRVLQDGLYIAMLTHIAFALLLLWLAVRCHSGKTAA